MGIQQTLFMVLAAISLITALGVVLSKSPVSSVLCLILTFFTIAGHYILLNAQFLAVVHIIVYAGAIMVLFLFVIMLLNLNKETEPHKSLWLKGSAAVASGSLLVVLVGAFRNAEHIRPANAFNPNVGLIENLGRSLFSDFLLPFEVSSILLLGAMIGAVMLGKKSIK